MVRSFMLMVFVVACGGGKEPVTPDAGIGDCPDDPFVGSDAVCGEHCTSGEQCLPGWACVSTENIDQRCVCEPDPETCNNVDDDCDGIVDTPAATDPLCVASTGPGYGCVEGECVYCPDRCGERCVDLEASTTDCGTCGQLCSDGTCSTNGCRSVQVLDTSAPALYMAIDDRYAYWNDRSTYRIHRCALPDCAGGPQTLPAIAVAEYAMTVVDHIVYWFRSRDLYRCSDEECSGLQLVSDTTQSVEVSQLVAANGRLYWQTATGIASCVPATCDATKGLFPTTTSPGQFLIDGAGVYWTES